MMQTRPKPTLSRSVKPSGITVVHNAHAVSYKRATLAAKL